MDYFAKRRSRGKPTGFNTRMKKYDLTLTEMFERFMEVKKTEGLSKVTINDHYTHFLYFCEFIGQDLQNQEINADIFRKYISYMLEERQVSPVTVNARIRPLRTLLRFAYNEGWIEEPVFEKFKPLKTPEDTIESLTPAEIKLIFAQIDETTYAGMRDKAMLYTLLDTMVRISELLKIRRENVDLKNGIIQLEAHETKMKRKRIVPISLKTIKVLRYYMSETEVFGSDVLFLTYNGDSIDSNTVRKRLMDYAKNAGISKRVSPHVWRHSGALLYIKNGGDPFSLQKILGHTDMSMVRKYIQMTNTDVKAQHNYFSPLKGVIK
ncbi:tyrosine-type recombinase/integrase [Bacillus marinisedimentorum]|uniref:tyrosine-type recombinase/integrase n=1 Tax=Bacillus marinisedimentorum TaxID=1821260 RepID=UPI0007E2A43C|nr:tyrosine-type recombinase/integrase [Bacillus marinisedimentorum]